MKNKLENSYKPSFDRDITAFDYLKITVVFDNNPYSYDLKTSWGFACVIEGPEKTVLFDTGGDEEILMDNMDRLKISPVAVDVVFLSHIHGDHTGGIRSFLERNNNFTVYVPQSFPSNFNKNVAEYGAAVLEVDKPVKICKDVYSSGELSVMIKEQSLILRTDKGLVIITGCAHPVIVNIIEVSKKLFGYDILFVMGGFHLGSYDSNEIRGIASEFKRMGVCYAGPCHCSGDNARRIFKEEFGALYRYRFGKNNQCNKIRLNN